MGDCLSMRSVAATIKLVQVMNKERSLFGSWFWRFLGSRVLAGLSCGEEKEPKGPWSRPPATLETNPVPKARVRSGGN